MTDQADHLRELARRTAEYSPGEAAGPPSIVVSGGKGGVGATTAALHLAIALGESGYRAVLVDADLRHAGATILAKVETAARGTLQDVLAGRRTAAEALVQGPAQTRILPGDWLRPSPPHLEQSAPQRFHAELARLERTADVLIVDVGSGLSPWAASCWCWADLVLAVTTPDNVSVMDTYAMLKHAASNSGLPPVHLLCTKCESTQLARQVHERFARAVFRFLGELIPDHASLPPLPHQTPDGEVSRTLEDCGEYYPAAARQLADTLAARLELEAASLSDASAALPELLAA